MYNRKEKSLTKDFFICLHLINLVCIPQELWLAAMKRLNNFAINGVIYKKKQRKLAFSIMNNEKFKYQHYQIF